LIAARKEAFEALKTPNVLDALLDPSKDAVAELTAALQARAALHVLADPHGIEWRGVSEDGHLANGRAVDEVVTESAKALSAEALHKVHDRDTKPKATPRSTPTIEQSQGHFTYTPPDPSASFTFTNSSGIYIPCSKPSACTEGVIYDEAICLDDCDVEAY
jgi:hypothetical protein